MKHDMIRRFAFIETRLLWGGGLTATELAEAFGIARQNAQQVIAAYNLKHPRQMRYDRQRRCQVQTETFKVHYIRDHVGRFLDYQRAVSHAALFHDDPSWVDLPFADADELPQPIYQREAVRAVLTALLRSRVVEIDYWSKKSTRVRKISPHHLVFADGRYHLRAFCHDRGIWLDFVLSRIFAAQLVDGEWISGRGDVMWHEVVDLSFIVNPALPENAQMAIRMDYIPPGRDRLVVPRVRKALEHYIRRRLCRLDWRFEMPLWIAVREQS